MCLSVCLMELSKHRSCGVGCLSFKPLTAQKKEKKRECTKEIHERAEKRENRE